MLDQLLDIISRKPEGEVKVKDHQLNEFPIFELDG